MHAGEVPGGSFMSVFRLIFFDLNLQNIYNLFRKVLL